MCDLISIIIPVYNVDNYITECIQSICCQVYRKLQIITIDDGSSDNSSEVADDYCLHDERSVSIHKHNNGLSSARNIGLDIIYGSYLAFVDSDDVVSYNYIDLQYKICIKTNTSMTCCEVICFRDGEHCIFDYFNLNTYHILSAKKFFQGCSSNKLYHDNASVCNKLYITRIFSNIRFPIGKYHEDEFVCYKLMHLAGSCTFLDQALYGYRQIRYGSIQHQISLRHIDVLDAYQEKLDFFKKYYPEFTTNIKLHVCLTGYYLLDNYKRKLSIDEFKQARISIYLHRRKINFSFYEWIGLSFRHKFYILISYPIIIDFWLVFKQIFLQH